MTYQPSAVFLRRIRAAPIKLSEAELSKYRSTIYGVAAHVGHVPKMSFGELMPCQLTTTRHACIRLDMNE